MLAFDKETSSIPCRGSSCSFPKRFVRNLGKQRHLSQSAKYQILNSYSRLQFLSNLFPFVLQSKESYCWLLLVGQMKIRNHSPAGLYRSNRSAISFALSIVIIGVCCF